MTTQEYKIGVIIPYRNDRPLFLENLFRMIERQTFQPTKTFLIDFKPDSETKDITQRYRIGYDFARDSFLDVIFLMEVDDYYSTTYIESMLNEWIEAGKPDLFGTRSTIYYHIGLFKGYTMRHETRSSAMSTMIKPDLNFAWCKDSEPYTDSWLYTQLNYKLWQPPKPICIGIKHGVGMLGGEAHTTNLHAYTDYNTSFDDNNKQWLKSVMDLDSFSFYSNYFK